MIYQFYANIKYTCYLYDIAIYCNRSAWHVGIASHSWYWYNICILQNIYCIRDTSNKILIYIYLLFIYKNQILLSLITIFNSKSSNSLHENRGRRSHRRITQKVAEFHAAFVVPWRHSRVDWSEGKGLFEIHFFLDYIFESLDLQWICFSTILQ